MGQPGARSLAAAAVITSFFLLLGGAPLFDVDEGAFSQATLEMFQRGDFLSTYLNGEPRYDKPILVYWLQAASVAHLGTRGARLAGAAGPGGHRRAVVHRHCAEGRPRLHRRLFPEAQRRAFQRPGLGARRQPALLLPGGADSQPAVHGADRAGGAT